MDPKKNLVYRDGREHMEALEVYQFRWSVCHKVEEFFALMPKKIWNRFSVAKIGNFELTQQEKTMTGKEPTSKISKVKNETTFILGIKLSFESGSRTWTGYSLCVVRLLSYVIACAAAATLERNQIGFFIQKSSKTSRKITRNCNPFHRAKSLCIINASPPKTKKRFPKALKNTKLICILCKMRTKRVYQTPL